MCTKIAPLLFFFFFFFITRCQCGNCQLMWKEKESIFCQKVDVVKNKNLEDVTEEQLQAEARFIVQHPGFEETGEGWLRPLHLFRYKTSLHSACLVFVFFSLNPVVFCPYCNVSTTRSGTVLNNLSLNIYIYIYIFFFFFQVVISETLRACYFRSTSLSLTRFLFLTKALRFKLWVQGNTTICALMVSSLRPSACFIYDERAWVIYCSLSWQWYIFETSNLSDRIDLIIMLPVANEKQQGVSFNIRLQHVSVIIHVHRKLIKLRHAIVLYILVNVTCNHSWRTLSWRRNASKEIIKKLHQQEVFLCAAH